MTAKLLSLGSASAVSLPYMTISLPSITSVLGGSRGQLCCALDFPLSSFQLRDLRRCGQIYSLLNQDMLTELEIDLDAILSSNSKYITHLLMAPLQHLRPFASLPASKPQTKAKWDPGFQCSWIHAIASSYSWRGPLVSQST